MVARPIRKCIECNKHLLNSDSIKRHRDKGHKIVFVGREVIKW